MFDLFKNLNRKISRRSSPQNEAQVDSLYAAIMAASRQPVFYRREYGAADTLEGRYDLLLLHACVILERLAGAPDPGPQIAQDLTNRIFAELDAALREMGVGDLTVPKRIKKMAEAFVGRSQAYKAAFRDSSAPEAALARALARNVYGSDDPAKGQRLARYALIARENLERDALDGILRSAAAQRNLFPDPAQFERLHD